MAKKKSKAKPKTQKKGVKKAAKKKTVKKAAKKAAKKTKKVIKKTTKPKKAMKKSAPKSTKKKSVKAKPAKKVAAKKKVLTPKTAKTPASNPSTLVGSDLPNMTLPNQNGQNVDLSSVIQDNEKVVLYFYPKDDTPGCTKQACDFRDNMNRIQAKGIKILGVSPDDADSHQKFIEKYGLNFDLLTDTNHALADAMGVWKEKNFMGKSYMGVERSTFIIENGKISKAWQPVQVEGHVDAVLGALES